MALDTYAQAALNADTMQRLLQDTQRREIDARMEALLTSLNVDTPNNPTAKNFGGDELRGIREFVKRASAEGLPTLTSSQMTELLAQAQEGKNIKPLDPKAEIRPDDIRSLYEPETGTVSVANPNSAIPGTPMANAITALATTGPVRSEHVVASARVVDDPFLHGKPPATPSAAVLAQQELAR